jgi:hypothetical protein
MAANLNNKVLEPRKVTLSKFKFNSYQLSNKNSPCFTVKPPSIIHSK